jgi:hypothetical protein
MVNGMPFSGPDLEACLDGLADVALGLLLGLALAYAARNRRTSATTTPSSSRNIVITNFIGGSPWRKYSPASAIRKARQQPSAPRPLPGLIYNLKSAILNVEWVGFVASLRLNLSLSLVRGRS